MLLFFKSPPFRPLLMRNLLQRSLADTFSYGFIKNNKCSVTIQESLCNEDPYSNQSA